MLSYRKIAIFALLVAFLFFTEKRSFAQNNLDILDILTNLSKNNPQILAKQAIVKQNKEEINFVKSKRYPNITSDINASSFITEPSSFGANSGEMADISLTISQPLYKGGRTNAKIKETEFLLQASIAELENATQNIFFETLKTYISAIKNKKIVTLRKQNIKTLKKQLEYEQIRQDLGENSITDVTQAESRLAAAKANLSIAEGDLLNSVTKYKRLTNSNIPNINKIDKIPTLNLSSLNIDDLQNLLKIAKENSPNVQYIQLQEKANLENYKFIKGEKYPSLDIVGQTKRFYKPTFAPNESYQDQSNISIKAKLPLFLGGSVKAKLKQSKYEQQNLSQQLNDKILDIEQNIAISVQNIKTAKAEIIARKSQLKTTAIALEGVKEEFKLGGRTTLDILNAEEEKLNAQVNLTIAKYNLSISSLSLINNLGLLSLNKFSNFLPK